MKRKQQQETDDKRRLQKQGQWGIVTENLETRRTEDDKGKTT